MTDKYNKASWFEEWKERTFIIIFEHNTPQGKAFDIGLMVVILASVLVVMLESVSSLQVNYTRLFFILEWVFTIFFTIEYIVRLLVARNSTKYATSFFGIVDLLSIAPTYLSLFVVGTHYLTVIRIIRLMRIFRIFKLAHFLKEGSTITTALRASVPKITVFTTFIVFAVMIIGSIMYVIEGGETSAFTSIPRSIYWAVVTLTTVGYGDIHPVTAVGQFFAAVVMMLGYAIIAVPTGIVTSELTIEMNKKNHERICPKCDLIGHDHDANHCKNCGKKLLNNLKAKSE